MKKQLIILFWFVILLTSGCSKYIEYEEQVKVINLPYDFLEISEQNLDSYIYNLKSQEGIYSVIDYDEFLNITLSENKLEEIKENLILELKNYIKNVELSSGITSISYNSSIDEFLIYTNLTEVTKELEDISNELFKKGGLYQSFLFKDPKNTSIFVTFLNPDNSIISKINSLETLNTLKDEHEH